MIKLKNNITLAIFIVCGVYSISGFAGTAVIVHPDSAAIRKQDVNRAYLGFAKSFPSGESIQLIDQSERSRHREIFYRVIVRKNSTQMKQHWARLAFTGQGKPPKVLSDDIAIRKMVAATPGAIGYIDEAAVNESIKVIFTLSD